MLLRKAEEARRGRHNGKTLWRYPEKLLELVVDVWRKGHVLNNWRDAVLVPIPKKGDLTVCDNWREICLLEVVGKVVARVIQESLQKLAEDVSPKSQ